MRIVLGAPIFPPAIGGPSEYAKQLAEAFTKKQHHVRVVTFTFESRLPTGIRHLIYFFKLIPRLFNADCIITLDTFSAALPAVWAAMIMRKKLIIRTGGDFLWEQYVERTKEKILFREFYKRDPLKFTLKEKMIFRLTKFILHRTDALVFSTVWQQQIWQKPYELSKVKKIFIIENYYGPKAIESSLTAFNKVFVAGTRKLVWKNLDTLEQAFRAAQEYDSTLVLDTKNLPYKPFLEKMKASYAVILVSLGDISPNMILDAIRLEKPFIITRENGLTSRIGDLGISVDPLNVTEIADAIRTVSQKEIYERELSKLRSFTFVHTYEDIADEFISIFHQL